MKTVLSKATSLPALSEEDLDEDTISSKSKTRSKSIDSDKEYKKWFNFILPIKSWVWFDYQY